MSKAVGKSNSTQIFKIHNYFVTDIIGRGKFSTVRRCFHNETHKMYAMKILSKRKYSGFSVGNDFLYNETVIYPMLSHPNILSVKEVVDSAAQVFQLQKCCTGGDLIQLMKGRDTEFSSMLSIFDQLLAAVEYLHHYHICHRDIKLDNVMLTDKHVVKLGDFGLMSIAFSEVTGSRGSLPYAAPEVLKKEPYDGFAADMWSCGVLFYALLAHSFPYKPHDNDVDFSKPVSYSGIPAEVQPMLAALLSLDPTKRPSAKDVRRSPVFDQLENRTPFMPQTPLALDIKTLDFHTLSKLSQILNTPIPDLTRLLRSKNDNPEKLLYFLYTDKTNKTLQSVAKSNTLRRTRSGPSFSVQRGDTLYECKVPGANSAQLFDSLSTYLIAKRCCVTSPVCSMQNIVLNSYADDLSVSFECFDDPDDCGCQFFLSNFNSDEFVSNIFQYLNTLYPSLEHTVLVAA